MCVESKNCCSKCQVDNWVLITGHWQLSRSLRGLDWSIGDWFPELKPGDFEDKPRALTDSFGDWSERMFGGSTNPFWHLNEDRCKLWGEKERHNQNFDQDRDVNEMWQFTTLETSWSPLDTVQSLEKMIASETEPPRQPAEDGRILCFYSLTSEDVRRKTFKHLKPTQIRLQSGCLLWAALFGTDAFCVYL